MHRLLHRLLHRLRHRLQGPGERMKCGLQGIGGPAAARLAFAMRVGKMSVIGGPGRHGLTRQPPPTSATAPATTSTSTSRTSSWPPSFTTRPCSASPWAAALILGSGCTTWPGASSGRHAQHLCHGRALEAYRAGPRRRRWRWAPAPCIPQPGRDGSAVRPCARIVAARAGGAAAADSRAGPQQRLPPRRLLVICFLAAAPHASPARKPAAAADSSRPHAKRSLACAATIFVEGEEPSVPGVPAMKGGATCASPGWARLT